MTAKRRLIPENEIRGALELFQEMGFELGVVDVRSNGITVYPKSEGNRNAFDEWKKGQPNPDGRSHR